MYGFSCLFPRVSFSSVIWKVARVAGDFNMHYGYELVGAFIFTVFCIVLARIYSFINRVYVYWDERNLKGPRPAYILGTWEGFAHKFLGNEDCCNKSKYGKVYGTFDGLTPNMLVCEPKMIQEILDTSSEKFQDLRFVSENSIILKESLLSLCGGEKSEIQMLTNSLLHPQKFEKLVPKLNTSLENLMHDIDKNRQEDGLLNITSSVTEFIKDVTALMVFGIELSEDVQFKEEFVSNCDKIFRVKDPQSIRSLLPFLYGNYFKEHWICPEKSLQYFVNLILKRISKEPSESDQIEKTECDLIELLVEAAEEEKKLVIQEKDESQQNLVLKDSVIISKCIATMLSLMNATRTTLLMALNTLAQNEVVQERLYEEVEREKAEKLTYGNIQKMTYLDQFMKEILRMYPFEFRLEKITMEDVKINDIDLHKGIRVSIPLYALHYSEDLYPEPNKFDPERFSKNASEKRNQFSYLPFGQAGINGSDFSIQIGILTSKYFLFKLVEKYKFSEVQEKSLNSLFKKGFTRIPYPENISILVKTRTKDNSSEKAIF